MVWFLDHGVIWFLDHEVVWFLDHGRCLIVSLWSPSIVRKQLSFMLGRQQMFRELDEDCSDADDLTEIMSNVHLNTNFLNLAREVWSP